MASGQLTAPTFSARLVPSFEGLKLSMLKFASVGPFKAGSLAQRSFRGLVVRAATVVAPKLERVGQLESQIEISVKTGSQVVYSKYAGTELEFNGSTHLILKEDDILGILETDDVEDLKPLNEIAITTCNFLIDCHASSILSNKVAEAEEKTTGGLLLTEASKEKPSIGTVIAVEPGPLDDEGNRKPLVVSAGNIVMYSKYAGNDFKGSGGSDYIVLRASDVMAVLS
ncbi:hypothetical protein BT93_H1857 [Corymbia citriodora subsp. variegata]|nr:hypothetical protein BT93_H1857 [Corymbia citriodora subsp. variegata]